MSYPYPPGQQPYGAPQVPEPPPPPARAAWILLLVLASLAVLSAALLPLQRSYVEAAMRESLRRVPDATASPLSEGDVTVVLGFVTALAVFFILVRVVLWVWLAVMVWQGRNWARIVVTVIAGLGLAGLAVGFAVLLVGIQGAATTQVVRPNPVLYLPGVVTGAVYVALLVLLWRPRASRWFTARTAWRRQQAMQRGSPAGPAW